MGKANCKRNGKHHPICVDWWNDQNKKKIVFEIPKYFPAGSLFKAMLHFIENDIKTNSVGRLIKQDSCVAECGAR